MSMLIIEELGIAMASKLCKYNILCDMLCCPCSVDTHCVCIYIPRWQSIEEIQEEGGLVCKLFKCPSHPCAVLDNYNCVCVHQNLLSRYPG